MLESIMPENQNGWRALKSGSAFVSSPVCIVNWKRPACVSSFVRKPNNVGRRARRHEVLCMGPDEPSNPSEPTSEESKIPDEELKKGLERLFESSPSEWPVQDDFEDNVLGDIKNSGMKDIEKLVGDLKDELTDVDAATEKYAKDLVEDEMGKVLVQYQEKQEEILESQKLQLQEIRKEAQLIQDLATSVQNPPPTEKDRAAREKMLLLLSGTFGVAAAYYFWFGIVENSSNYLQNAAVDAIVAGLIAFLSSSSLARGKSNDETN